MKYDEELLKRLIEIYEKRDANSAKLNRPVKIVFSKDKYSQYFNDPSGYDEAIRMLSSLGFVKIKYLPHDTVIDSISLNFDKVNEIKSLLGIESVSDKRNLLLNELDKYDDIAIVEFKKEIEHRISNNKSIKQYLSSDYIDLIRAVHYIENLKHDVYERNASNFIFNDSKRLSKLKPLLQKFYNSENVFVEKGILSVTPYLYVKGQGVITINGQDINLSLIKKSIGIPIDDLNALTFKGFNKITTIENLTTFYDYESDGLIIYLGGFSTRSQVLVLEKLIKNCNEFYHFGDIDYGGFSILNNLMENLNIEIKTINMDINTLTKNKNYLQSFDDLSYVIKLKSLLNKPKLKPYKEVIEYMIENKVWLEQESCYNN